MRRFHCRLHRPFVAYNRATNFQLFPATPTLHSRTMATEKSPSVETTSNTDTTKPSNTPLPLPEPSQDQRSTILDVSSGQGVKLDHLGPMVVNRDGTLSRIGNWEQMTEVERRNTVRILGKRNQLRMDALRSEEESAKEPGAQ